jgi:hypothetical protein
VAGGACTRLVVDSPDQARGNGSVLGDAGSQSSIPAAGTDLDSHPGRPFSGPARAQLILWSMVRPWQAQIDRDS